MTDPHPGRQTVTAAGTAEPLSREPFRVTRVDLFALDANTDRIYVGGPAVSAVASNQQGAPFSAKEQLWFENVDLADIWIDAAVSGEGVTWIARLGTTSFTTSF